MGNAVLFASPKILELISRKPGLCELWGKCCSINTSICNYCLYVVRMSRSRINSLLDEYELAIDEIVAACDGDVRGALRALMLLNEQLEQQLERVSGELDGLQAVHPSYRRSLH